MAMRHKHATANANARRKRARKNWSARADHHCIEPQAKKTFLARLQGTWRPERHKARQNRAIAKARDAAQQRKPRTIEETRESIRGAMHRILSPRRGCIQF